MNWLIEKVKNFNKRIAIIQEGDQYTYSDLHGEILRSKNLLRQHKVYESQVVSVLSDYSLQSIALIIALQENKNIIVPITSITNDEIKYRIVESNSDKCIQIKDNEYVVEEFNTTTKHIMIKNLIDRKKSGLVLFSSGTTAKPKAMIHDFDNLVESYRSKKEKTINMILFLMFDHIGGLNTLYNILSMGAAMIVPENRRPDEVCRLIQEYKVRVLPSSPTFLNLILMNKSHEMYNLDSVRMVTYGTEAMPETLLLKLKTAFPRAKFLQTFGTSETGIVNTISKSSNSTYMKIDDPNIEHKIVGGELWLKSDTQVMGYLNASMENFTDDGWFKTGDLVEEVSEGYIRIVGRNKEVINVGGEKVLPNEVESVILSMPEVEDVVVYGEKNSITGYTVVCDVVSNLSRAEAKKAVRKFCSGKINSYKIPTKVNTVPRTDFSDRMKKIRKINRST